MEALYYIGISQALFSLLLLVRKEDFTKADSILSLIIITMGIEMLYSLFNFQFYPPLPDMILIPYLFGPLLYIYAYLLTSKNNSYPPKYYLHFIPFVVFLIWASLDHSNVSNPQVSFGAKGGIQFIHVFNFVFFIGVLSYYSIIISKRLKGHRKTIQNVTAIDSDKITLLWLERVSLLLFLGMILSILADGYFFIAHIFPFEAAKLLHICLLLAIYSISFYGFRQETIFKINSNLTKETESEKQHTENKELSLDEETEQNLIVLKEYMMNEKPFLSGDLSLQDVANKTHIPAYKLSLMLNKHLNKNFFTFINEYRVEEVKRRIASKEYDNFTLRAIAADCGFNSKSSFHTLFKRFTDMTPSQYKRSLDRINSINNIA